MHFRADDHLDRRGAEHPVSRDIPSSACQKRMTCRDERREIRHGGTGNQAPCAFRGQFQCLTNPAKDYFLQFRRDGRHHAQCRILVPRRRQPIGSQRCGNHPTVHEAEERPPVVTTVAPEPISSSLAITSQGSLGERGKGSLSSARVATADSEGLTLRSATPRTYLRALSAARFRRALLCGCAPDPVSIAIRFSFPLRPRFSRAQGQPRATGSLLAHRIRYSVFDGMKEQNCPLTSSRLPHRKRSCRRG